MSRHTKYIQEMIRQMDNGAEYVRSTDKLVTIEKSVVKECGKFVDEIYCWHYGTRILTIVSNDSLRHVGKNGWSFSIGEFAYSPTDARIINQLLERYVPGFVAHSRKGEVIVD